MPESGRRPDADALLARVKQEERRAERGRLTIFFGAAPGVGKTYAMLEAARSERGLRRDVVIGIVEAHGRYDTAALTIGLELVPRRRVDHRGVSLEELDLDGVLARRPGLVLVDELAHTNAPGSRHPKRWQDVEELLDAGIDVFTTVNVQHLESLNDIVAQITGVVVRETVPDRVLDEADEIRLVDLPVQDLLERLQDGKVYVAEQARRALQGFFKRAALTALRELALRETAERVDDQVRSERRAEGVEHTWPLAERLLVCLSPSPASARLVRSGRRMAASLRGEWIAAYVETPAALRMSEADRERVADHLRLAEKLGAETVRLSGENAAAELVAYARSRNVTKLVVGKPTHPRWRDLLRRSFLEEVVRASPDIDVHVITGVERDGPTAARAESAAVREKPRLTLRGAIAAVLASALATTIGRAAFRATELADVAMLYVLGIVLVAMRFGFGPSILAAVLGVLAFDFFFVPPALTFAVSDARHILTFIVMFVVAVVISRLAQRIRDQAETARQRELRSSRLYAMSRELASAASLEEVCSAAVKHVGEAFDANAGVLLADAKGELGTAFCGDGHFVLEGNDRHALTWVWEHERPAGLGTDTLPGSSALFLPLRAPAATVGILAIRPRRLHDLGDPDRRQLLDTFAAQIAGAFDRVRLGEQARRAEVEAEGERLRSSLLSSVSHDLRTPLSVITGATSTLLDEDVRLDGAARRELLVTAHEEAEHLNRLVKNLLDMTQLAAGAIRPKKEWHLLEELVGVALRRLDRQLEGHPVRVDLPADLPAVPLDDVLVEQVLFNLLENAAKYTPPGAAIEISARAVPHAVEVIVADRGTGIPLEARAHVFDKFYRGARDGGGAGLGLAICRGFIEAHGGQIWVAEGEGGGARFGFTLPIEGEPPAVNGAQGVPS